MSAAEPSVSTIHPTEFPIPNTQRKNHKIKRKPAPPYNPELQSTQHSTWVSPPSTFAENRSGTILPVDFSHPDYSQPSLNAGTALRDTVRSVQADVTLTCHTPPAVGHYLQQKYGSPLRTSFRTADFTSLATELEEGNKRIAKHLDDFGSIANTFQDKIEPTLPTPSSPTVTAKLRKPRPPRSRKRLDSSGSQCSRSHEGKTIQAPRSPSSSLSQVKQDTASSETLPTPAAHDEKQPSPTVPSVKSEFFFRSEHREEQTPTPDELEFAASLDVVSETGEKVPFGSLWRDQRTIVLFIRHFLCPWCQDYLLSLSTSVSHSILEEAGLSLAIISNGSHAIISSYRKLFRMPFSVYTDPSLQVYDALGMTKYCMSFGNTLSSGLGPRGEYIRHGTVFGLGIVMAKAVKVNMPIWRGPGSIEQLGGEFILGPGMNCSFVHRMPYPRAHMSILTVIEKAGVDMATQLTKVRSLGRTFLGMSLDEEEKWMSARRAALAAIRNRKAARRSGTGRYINPGGLDARFAPPLGMIEEDMQDVHYSSDSDDEYSIRSNPGRLIMRLVPDAESLCLDSDDELEVEDLNGLDEQDMIWISETALYSGSESGSLCNSHLS